MQTFFPDSGLAAADWLATSADHAACRALIRSGSKSFFAASLLLPAKVRRPALALYGFCRLADDAVDNDSSDNRFSSNRCGDNGHVDNPLNRLRERLALAYAGRPAPSAADRAFADVVSQYAIPRDLPEALLEGFDWDIQGRRYEDIAQLEAYAARVAGSVGAMMACLMDAREPHLVARACDLGVAMQLTNIARDVGEDARAGRLYLPLSWLREAGIDPDEWMRNPAFTPPLAQVISRLLVAADALYERADVGISGLPRECRRGIRAARFLYAEIGHELRRNGLDSVSRRTVAPAWRKLTVLARAWAAAHPRPGDPQTGPLQPAQFLVDAAATRPGPHRPSAAIDFDQKIEWLFGLFERLERRDRQQPNRAT
jgi:15-cis-phytoene synthase